MTPGAAPDATMLYVIFELFPWVTGNLTRKSDGAEVVALSGQGGGELSVARATQAESSVAECNAWGAKFRYPPAE